MGAVNTLYTYPENFRAYKALIAAEYSGTRVKVVSAPPDFVLGVTNKTDEFLSKFPLGKVPALTTAEGKNFSESNAIAFYLADEQLRGKSVEDKAFVQQWVSFADNEILPASSAWVFPVMGIMPPNKQAMDKARAELRRSLLALNSHLHYKTFLVGERITLADISVMSNLMLAYKWVLDPEFRAGFNNVTRWFVTMVNQKNVKKVVGDFTLCSKAAQVDGKKMAEVAGNKPSKGAAVEKPASKKESKDPFAGFPKSAFVLDEFKRVYSNEDIKTKAIPHFWQNFDAANYSIWLCEYKFPEDLGLMFQSENLIT